ncbi:YobA family protein [Evansella sp. AB-P1]|uniref:YobA family protein n=1 Tax=Evansella sp. AB-P1 TaxID=3037653 RepID=UPI00241F7008|nr:YobA family protein [Evansella sp. AB-P1]MDG5786839.1 YobA family protein [Evansella sp. AB-P1]
MKFIISLFSIFLIFILGGCMGIIGDQQEGYIVEINERILVVSGISQEEAVEMTEEDILHPETSVGSATWFSVTDSDQYEVGQLVRVSFRAMNESYPGQATATSVKVLEE